MSDANNKSVNGFASEIRNGVSHDDIPQNGVSSKSPAQDPKNFLRQLFEVLLRDGLEKGTDVKCKVVDFKHPHELFKTMDLSLKERGDSDERLIELCKETLNYSIRTNHPRFFNQLYGGVDWYGLGGTWLTETVNTSQYTYEVAPVFTLMEEIVLKKLRDCVGYKDGDGIFCPGGSVSNMYGVSLARFKMFPGVKEDGLQSLPSICLFSSEQGHYSLKKAASFMGMGTKCVIPVPCDEQGRMMPAELDRLIVEAKAQGKVPFLVNATGGTTVAGAYDPLDEIADVCEKHQLWMHVDTAWGGGALLSSKHKHLLKGLDRADSVTWNPHKMMGAPLQCCAFLTKHKGLLAQCHSASARYLFQQDKFYDVSYDTGDKSIQCGRKVDVFKLWLMWRAKGDKGFEEGIDNIFSCAQYLIDIVRKTEGFRLVFPKPECTNVCFWYIPPSLRGQEENEEWWAKLSQVAPKIKERMVMQGTMLIGYQPLGSKVNFFRMVVSNLASRKEDMEFVVEEIDRLGRDL